MSGQDRRLSKVVWLWGEPVVGGVSENREVVLTDWMADSILSVSALSSYALYPLRSDSAIFRLGRDLCPSGPPLNIDVYQQQ